VIELWDTSALILAAMLADALAADEVAISEPILLEYLNGARNLSEYRRFADALGATHMVETSPVSWRRALEVHALLAETGAGHQRSVRIVDLIVAAAAEFHGYQVVHCDKDYERIASLTGQPTRRIGA
jgi:hypothetical protein